VRSRGTGQREAVSTWSNGVDGWVMVVDGVRRRIVDEDNDCESHQQRGASDDDR
jgi:hypothetical protein